MNILIIAKIFHAKNDARAIQMRRVVDALNNYSEHHITVITEDSTRFEKQDGNVSVINIPTKKPRFPRFLNLFDQYIGSYFLIYKDNFISSAITMSEKIMETQKIEVILSVSTPFESHLVGLALKEKHSSIKWVTFFSDIWPSILLPTPYKKRKMLSSIEVSYMRKVIEKCNILLTPSQYAIEILHKKFKTKALLKSIPHCSREMDDSVLNSGIDGYIVHSGYFQGQRISKELVEAVKELSDEYSGFKGLMHIGPFDKKLMKIISEYKCRNFYLLGQIPEELSSSIQNMIGISLIVEAPMKDFSPFMPSKITDSIANSRKIISISPERSFLSDFSKSHSGLFVCTYEKQNIKVCIKDALKSEICIEDSTRDYFNQINIAKSYCDIFEMLN